MSNGGGRSRSGDPDTSRDAIGPGGVSILEWKYLLALYRHAPELSTTSIALYWEEVRDSYSPRSVPLMDQHMIKYVGKRLCKNFAGRMINMRHYRLTDNGRAYVKRVLEFQAKHGAQMIGIPRDSAS